jgi:hypothetical protein
MALRESSRTIASSAHAEETAQVRARAVRVEKARNRIVIADSLSDIY